MAQTLWQSRTAGLLARMDRRELQLCRRFNAAVHRVGARRLFQAASRLGDGVAWYALAAALPLLFGHAGLLTSLRMAVAGTVGLLLYRYLKRTFVRERPFITHAAITLAGSPLDRFSFPSGHTLHAVSFTAIAVTDFPLLAPVLLPFALLVALSRVVLGLHYPSDVLVGALIGFGLATSALAFG
jgi:undecaprenyl-diphosphatase